MLLLAAIGVGDSLPALPALYHAEKQNGTILPYFPAILSKIEESIRRPLYLGCQQVADALRAGHGAFRIWAVMPGEKQPRRRIAKHGRSVFCVLIVYSKAADFGGVGGRSQTWCVLIAPAAPKVRIAGCKTPRQPQKKAEGRFERLSAVLPHASMCRPKKAATICASLYSLSPGNSPSPAANSTRPSTSPWQRMGAAVAAIR